MNQQSFQNNSTSRKHSYSFILTRPSHKTPSSLLYPVIMYGNYTPRAFLRFLLCLSLISAIPAANHEEFHNALQRADWRNLGFMTEWHGRRRRLQNASALSPPPCNQVLDTLSLEELQTHMADLLEELTGAGTFQNTYLRTIFYNNLKSGIQIWRICASCIDIPAETSGIDEFCGPNIYGSQDTFSGLLIVPTIADDSSTLLPGTLLGNLDMHPTTLTAYVPSLLWTSLKESDASIWFYLAISSTQKLVSLLPDYMGYAETNEKVHKGYMIKKSYETSIVPLWYQAKHLISLNSNCQSALGNAAVVSGYSEGGFVAVVVASRLAKLGVEIVQIHTGGAPYRVSTEAGLGIIELLTKQTLDDNFFYLLALVGASYSSTYASIANFEQDQDLIVRRDLVLEFTQNTELNYSSSFKSLADSVYGYGLEGFMHPGYLQASQQAIMDGSRDPCQTKTSSSNTTSLEELDMEFLCQSMMDNDLTHMLEQEVNFPTLICHSPDDELATIQNLPNMSANLNLKILNGISGTHTEAADYCILWYLNYAATNVNLANHPMEPLHQDESCPSSMPTLSPTTEKDVSSSTAWNYRWVALLLVASNL